MIKPLYKTPQIGLDILLAVVVIGLSLWIPESVVLDVFGRVAFIYLIGSLLMHKFFWLKRKYDRSGV